MIVFPERTAVFCSFHSVFSSLLIYMHPFWFHVSVNWSKAVLGVIALLYIKKLKLSGGDFRKKGQRWKCNWISGSEL